MDSVTSTKIFEDSTETSTRISPTQRLARQDWNFPAARATDDIHSLHPYPAKFIPEIPRALITELRPPRGMAVFDPFCGCGTTLVEAQLLGYPSVGVDLNPIACLISRVKTTPLPYNFEAAAANVVRKARTTAVGRIPRIPNLDHWFEPEVQGSLAALSREIADSCYSEDVRDCLRLAFSSIVVRVSNQDSDTRYAAVRKSVSAEKVLVAFATACSRIAAEKPALPFQLPEARVVQSDILAIGAGRIGPVGLVITSPPYPNAYEYWLYHKYRMWWLGYDPIAVRKREIGARAHYFKKNPPTVHDFRRQMKFVLSLAHEVLAPGGHACVVVGRSRIHGEDVDNGALIVDVSKKIGFSIVARIERTIASARKSFNLSHARIKTEEVLVFGR